MPVEPDAPPELGISNPVIPSVAPEGITEVELVEPPLAGGNAGIVI